MYMFSFILLLLKYSLYHYFFHFSYYVPLCGPPSVYFIRTNALVVTLMCVACALLLWLGLFALSSVSRNGPLYLWWMSFILVILRSQSGLPWICSWAMSGIQSDIWPQPCFPELCSQQTSGHSLLFPLRGFCWKTGPVVKQVAHPQLICQDCIDHEL